MERLTHLYVRCSSNFKKHELQIEKNKNTFDHLVMVVSVSFTVRHSRHLSFHSVASVLTLHSGKKALHKEVGHDGGRDNWKLQEIPT